MSETFICYRCDQEHKLLDNGCYQLIITTTEGQEYHRDFCSADCIFSWLKRKKEMVILLTE